MSRYQDNERNWVKLSGDFIHAMVSFGQKPPKSEPVKSKPVAPAPKRRAKK